MVVTLRHGLLNEADAKARNTTHRCYLMIVSSMPHYMLKYQSQTTGSVFVSQIAHDSSLINVAQNV